MSLEADLRKPALSNPVDSDLDAIRNNYQFLLAAALTGSHTAPGWTTVVDVSENNNYAQPDAMEHTNGTRVITVNYDYS